MLYIHCINAMETVAHFSKSSSRYLDIVSALQEGCEILGNLQKRI